MSALRCSSGRNEISMFGRGPRVTTLGALGVCTLRLRPSPFDILAALLFVLSPLLWNDKRTRPNTDLLTSRALFIGNVVHRIFPISNRPTVGYHPAAQVCAIRETLCNHPTITICAGLFATNRVRSD